MKEKTAATLIVLAHLAVLLAHSAAHVELDINPSPWQTYFIVIVIYLAPLAALLMLWTRPRAGGLILLALSMAGSLVFGVAYHFLIASGDNVFSLGHDHGTALFVATSVLLAVVEAAGCAGVDTGVRTAAPAAS